MNLLDEYRPASFRGAPFLAAADTQTGARDTVVHRWPGRDDSWREDHGLGPDDIEVDAALYGDDVEAQRDRLLDALRRPGPGALILPQTEERPMLALSWSVQRRDDAIGGLKLQLTFGAPGALRLPRRRVDPNGRIDAAAQAETAAATAAFQAGFSLDDAPDFVVDAAAADAARSIDASARQAARAGLAALMRDAAALAAAILRAWSAVPAARERAPNVSGDAPVRAAAIRAARDALLDHAHAAPQTTAPPPARPGPVPAARVRIASNRAALALLTRRAALINAARLIPTGVFETADEALAVRAALTRAADRMLLDAGPQIDPLPLRALVRAANDAIAARAADLPRLSTYTPDSTLPLDLIAYRLYGDDPAWDRRADDLAARNRIANPEAAPGAQPLEVVAA